MSDEYDENLDIDDELLKPIESEESSEETDTTADASDSDDTDTGDDTSDSSAADDEEKEIVIEDADNPIPEEQLETINEEPAELEPETPVIKQTMYEYHEDPINISPDIPNVEMTMHEEHKEIERPVVQQTMIEYHEDPIEIIPDKTAFDKKEKETNEKKLDISTLKKDEEFEKNVSEIARQIYNDEDLKKLYQENPEKAVEIIQEKNAIHHPDWFTEEQEKKTDMPNPRHLGPDDEKRRKKFNEQLDLIEDGLNKSANDDLSASTGGPKR